jgi:Flp pilus assembly protein TadB
MRPLVAYFLTVAGLLLMVAGVGMLLAPDWLALVVLGAAVLAVGVFGVDVDRRNERRPPG